jgi:hypothetical protein
MSSEAVMNSANSNNSVYTSPAVTSRRVTADQEQRLRKAFRYVYVCTHYTTIQQMYYRAHVISVCKVELQRILIIGTALVCYIPCSMR